MGALPHGAWGAWALPHGGRAQPQWLDWAAAPWAHIKMELNTCPESEPESKLRK